ncbi:MAG: hypothetical protein QOD74_2152 [Variibacter sp.]|jgi:hypothetical protein|nr:hypothetical protein [Variibacter sp.]
MKVTFDIECTPQEARQFFGLPDVQPMQKALMQEVQKRMMAEVDRFSPEGLMKSWFSLAPQNTEWFKDFFAGAQQPSAKRE